MWIGEGGKAEKGGFRVDGGLAEVNGAWAVSYTHLRAHET